MPIVDITIGNDGSIKKVDWVAWLMNELELPACTRKNVAKTYSYLLRQGHKEWAAINRAIIKRWSPSALRWIKEQAWKLVEKEAKNV